MGYVDNKIALFRDYARAMLEEYAALYKEKEKYYLSGFSIHRTRVLNGLAEMMSMQLKLKVKGMLKECKKEAPKFYLSLKTELMKFYNHYLTGLRNQGYEADYYQ